jgi:hypothetical protein
MSQGAGVGFLLDTVGDEDFDYTFLMYGQLKGPQVAGAGDGSDYEMDGVLLDVEGNPVPGAGVRVRKKGKRVKGSFKKDKVKKRKNKKMKSKQDSRYYTGEGPCAGGCRDVVPNSGRVKHDLG